MPALADLSAPEVGALLSRVRAESTRMIVSCAWPRPFPALNEVRAAAEAIALCIDLAAIKRSARRLTFWEFHHASSQDRRHPRRRHRP